MVDLDSDSISPISWRIHRGQIHREYNCPDHFLALAPTYEFLLLLETLSPSMMFSMLSNIAELSNMCEVLPEFILQLICLSPHCMDSVTQTTKGEVVDAYVYKAQVLHGHKDLDHSMVF
jgi:hypothetical protein